MFRRALGDDLAAGLAAIGAEVENPVGRRDHVEIMLDYDHRVAGLHETPEGLQENLDITEMKARGRLVEEEEEGVVFTLRAS